jgi:hypothetical protein
MNATNDIYRRRIISAVSCIGLAVFFLANPVMRWGVRGESASTGDIALMGFIAPLHVAMMVGAAIGITQLLRRKADRTGLIGAALAIMGWVIGSRIMVVGQLQALLANGVPGVPEDALGKMFQHAPLVFVSIIPFGLLFPIGLLVLGITLFIVRPVHRGIGALLAIGGVLFPLGRAVGLEAAIIGCDVVLGVTFALLAWHFVKRPEVWDA